MTKKSLKTNTIEKILTLTNKQGNIKAYDKLCDLDEKYLGKLAKVVEKLSK